MNLVETTPDNAQNNNGTHIIPPKEAKKKPAKNQQKDQEQTPIKKEDIKIQFQSQIQDDEQPAPVNFTNLKDSINGNENNNKDQNLENKNKNNDIQNQQSKSTNNQNQNNLQKPNQNSNIQNQQVPIKQNNIIENPDNKMNYQQYQVPYQNNNIPNQNQKNLIQNQNQIMYPYPPNNIPYPNQQFQNTYLAYPPNKQFPNNMSYPPNQQYPNNYIPFPYQYPNSNVPYQNANTSVNNIINNNNNNNNYEDDSPTCTFCCCSCSTGTDPCNGNIINIQNFKFNGIALLFFIWLFYHLTYITSLIAVLIERNAKIINGKVKLRNICFKMTIVAIGIWFVLLIISFINRSTTPIERTYRIVKGSLRLAVLIIQLINILVLVITLTVRYDQVPCECADKCKYNIDFCRANSGYNEICYFCEYSCAAYGYNYSDLESYKYYNCTYDCYDIDYCVSNNYFDDENAGSCYGCYQSCWINYFSSDYFDIFISECKKIRNCFMIAMIFGWILTALLIWCLLLDIYRLYLIYYEGINKKVLIRKQIDKVEERKNDSNNKKREDCNEFKLLGENNENIQQNDNKNNQKKEQVGKDKNNYDITCNPNIESDDKIQENNHINGAK